MHGARPVSEWRFPASTCETAVDGYPRQPWSTVANAVIIVMMLCRPKTRLVLSILVFETVHLVAHITHSNNLSVLQHYCTYAVMHYYAKPSRWTVPAQVIDTMVVAFVGGLWQVFTGFCLFYSYTIDDRRVLWGGTAVMLMMFKAIT